MLWNVESTSSKSRQWEMNFTSDWLHCNIQFTPPARPDKTVASPVWIGLSVALNAFTLQIFRRRQSWVVENPIFTSPTQTRYRLSSRCRPISTCTHRPTSVHQMIFDYRRKLQITTNNNLLHKQVQICQRSKVVTHWMCWAFRQRQDTHDAGAEYLLCRLPAASSGWRVSWHEYRFDVKRCTVPVSETRVVVIEYRYIKAPGRDSMESSGACVRHVSEWIKASGGSTDWYRRMISHLPPFVPSPPLPFLSLPPSGPLKSSAVSSSCRPGSPNFF